MIPLVQLRDLVKEFHLPGGWLTAQRRSLRAVDHISLEINSGEVFGLVGESGCGKTTLGRILLRLIEPTSGQVLFAGADLFAQKGTELRNLRKEMQIVFQNPLSSLSPRMKVLDIVAEPLRTHHILSEKHMRSYVLDLLKSVGLGAQHLDRYPHEISGGQCQRVAIARALALSPRLVVLDEPTSSLDVSVQAQIINLLQNLRIKKALTYLFISHDLGVVQHISDRIGVMYLGKLVEVGTAHAIFNAPQHPYTQALIGSIPLPNVRDKRPRLVLRGNVPSPINPPSGCRFHERCPLAQDICTSQEPPLHTKPSGSQVACHFVE